MAKIKLIPDPTFTAKVPVPVPGRGVVEVDFTFKYRTREELQAFTQRVQLPSEDAGALDDIQLVTECATGWELADAFTTENVKTFVAQYIAGPAAVFETYVAEMSGVRAKNSARPRS